jgi:hypothetical protein
VLWAARLAAASSSQHISLDRYFEIYVFAASKDGHDAQALRKQTPLRTPRELFEQTLHDDDNWSTQVMFIY